MPERFAFHEQQEREFRAMLGRDDVTILRDRRGGGSRPLTLEDLRLRAEAADQTLDLLEVGGCGCAVE